MTQILGISDRVWYIFIIMMGIGLVFNIGGIKDTLLGTGENIGESKPNSTLSGMLQTTQHANEEIKMTGTKDTYTPQKENPLNKTTMDPIRTILAIITVAIAGVLAWMGYRVLQKKINALPKEKRTTIIITGKRTKRRKRKR